MKNMREETRARRGMGLSFQSPKLYSVTFEDSGLQEEKEEDCPGYPIELVYNQSTIFFQEDWMLGEGKFNWKGRSKVTGVANHVTVYWERGLIVGYVAQLKNLNNDYHAIVGYFLELWDKQGGTKLAEHFLKVCNVSDENWYNPPVVVYDRENRHDFDFQFNYVIARQHVGWQ